MDFTYKKIVLSKKMIRVNMSIRNIKLLFSECKL